MTMLQINKIYSIRHRQHYPSAVAITIGYCVGIYTQSNQKPSYDICTNDRYEYVRISEADILDIEELTDQEFQKFQKFQEIYT